MGNIVKVRENNGNLKKTKNKIQTPSTLVCDFIPHYVQLTAL